MLKALLKKQALASAAFFLQGKDGKRRSTGAIIGFAALMLLAFVSMGYLMYELGAMLCTAFVSQGLTWLYFAFMGGMAFALGMIGSIFMAKSRLYEAKDNDLLLSMPISPWAVLFSRMVGLYAYTLLFEALVFLPALIAYFVGVGFSALLLFLGVLCLLLMPLGTLALCCLLGWLLALLAAKLPAKNILTTVCALLFMVGYFFLYSKLNEYLGYVIANGGVVAEKVKTLLFPLWKLGQACEGNWGAFGLYFLLSVLPFVLVYLLLSKTYLRLATANRGEKKVKYKSKESKQGSPFKALLKKEAMRFTKNPMIALNAMLGTAFLVILPFVILFSADVKTLLLMLGGKEIAAMLVAAILCMTLSMNMVSACAVSLEGESLWVVRSLPVPTEQVLLAKAGFHFLTTAIPSLFASVFIGIVLRLGVGYTVGVAILSTLFAACGAFFGVLVNLKMPNLRWTNELVAVKQSFSTILTMFAEWGILLLLVGGYFLFGQHLFAGGYLLVCIALLAATDGLLWVWLCRRGVKIFENL